MAEQHIILSVLAEDRPGIVSDLADRIKDADGNWLESSLSQLRGHFAGIIHVRVAEENIERLTTGVSALENQGIEVRVNEISQANEHAQRENHESLVLEVEANDRAGIVKEITNALSKKKVNVKHLETRRESAAMAGYDIFYAIMQADLPADVDTVELEQSLEALSDDLMVTIKAAT